jgi:hypothetical protein
MAEPKADWPQGSWVEINLRSNEETWGHDPNRYIARCMTGGTWPMLEVVCDDDLTARHPKFQEPLFEGDYVIWRIVRNADGSVPPPPTYKYVAHTPREPEQIVVRPEDLRRRRRKRKSSRKK